MNFMVSLNTSLRWKISTFLSTHVFFLYAFSSLAFKSPHNHVEKATRHLMKYTSYIKMQECISSLYNLLWVLEFESLSIKELLDSNCTAGSTPSLSSLQVASLYHRSLFLAASWDDTWGYALPAFGKLQQLHLIWTSSKSPLLPSFVSDSMLWMLKDLDAVASLLLTNFVKIYTIHDLSGSLKNVTYSREGKVRPDTVGPRNRWQQTRGMGDKLWLLLFDSSLGCMSLICL